MKRHESLVAVIIALVICLMSLPVQSQAPQSFNYQSIVRDAGGDPLVSQSISLRISLHQGSIAGTVIYYETHTATTSPLGLVNLTIGQGTVVSGSFANIPWKTGLYFLELEIDPAGGTSYVSLGTIQLLSVPYALYSETTGQEYTAGTGINISDDIITNTATDQVVTLTSGSGIGISGSYPNFIVANSAPNASHTGDATGNGALKVEGIQGRPVAITAPAIDQVLKWDGTQWMPATVSSGGGTTDWSLTGNSGTDPLVNFLGTTDNQPLRFKVNNQFAGEINPVTNNIFLGRQAGENSTGNSNIAIGERALYNNSDRSNLVAVGDSALYNNGTGVTQPYHATANTAVGSKALFSNTTGYGNTASGYGALYSNTTGSYNTASGKWALNSNKANSSSTAIGYQAMSKADNREEGRETYNTAVGYEALKGSDWPANNTGRYNTAIGDRTINYNTTGEYNTASGAEALYFNTTGSSNTAIGFSTLGTNMANSRSTAIGYQAMSKADNSEEGRETYNTAVGYEALKGSDWPANNTGRYNTAIGDRTINYNTTGEYNTANGAEALYFNTTGSSNTAIGFSTLGTNMANSRSTAIGYQAMSKADNREEGRETYNTAVGYEALKGGSWPPGNTGRYNTAIGDWALYTNTSGYNNTATGAVALYSNTTGSANTASGFHALYYNTEGYNNTANGADALLTNTSGDYNTALGMYTSYYNSESDNNTCAGYSAGDYFTFTNGTFLGALAYPVANGYTNCMALGYDAHVDASNKVVIGNTSVTSIGGSVDWTVFSDGRYKNNVREEVPGLDFISQLRPVMYTLDITSLNADLNKNRPATLRKGEKSRIESAEDMASREAKEKIVYTGFIAQEVESAARQIGYDFSGVDAPKNADGHYGLRYAEFVVPLVKGMQEQQVMIEELKTRNEEQSSMIEILLQRVASLEAELGR